MKINKCPLCCGWPARRASMRCIRIRICMHAGPADAGLPCSLGPRKRQQSGAQARRAAHAESPHRPELELLHCWDRERARKHQHLLALAALPFQLARSSAGRAGKGNQLRRARAQRTRQRRPTRPGPLAPQINLPLSQRRPDVPPQWVHQDGGSKPVDLQSMWQEVPAQGPFTAASAAA